MRVILGIGIIITVGLILMGVLWNSSLNTSKATEQANAQQEASGLKKQVDKLSESMKSQNVKYEESQKEIVRLNMQISQLLEREMAIKIESEVISNNQSQEASKLNMTLVILKEEVSRRKEEINKLQKEKESLSGADAQSESAISKLKEQNAKLEKRIKELEEKISELSKQEPPPVQYIAWNDNTVMELPKDKIIVVENTDDPFIIANSEYPRIENILDSFNIGYTVVSKEDFNRDKYSLDNKWAVLFNSETRNNNAVFSEKAIKKIQEFAESGGYVFTEHLDYEWILAKAFTRTFKPNGYLPAREVSIMVPPNVGLHPYLYLNNIFLEKSDGSTSSGYNNVYKWKVEDSGPDIKILTKGVVTTLMISSELAKVNSGDGIIAITFNAPLKLPYQEQDTKGGRVLHMAGILGKQKKPLHKLILNFLAELNQRRPRAK